MNDRLPDDVVERLGGLVGEEETRVDDRARPSLRRYELGEVIGEGAAGAVYRAIDRELNRQVAVKILKPVPGETGATAELRFQREAQVAARLSHPNLIPVYDVGREGDRIFLVMELVEGVSLQDAIRDRAPAPAQSAALMEKIARGVAAAHAQGIVHRDLKPANILLAKDGQPRVGDFGVAHLAEADVQLTRTGAVLGTPQYMAPEQVRGSGGLTPAADVHALGAILYEMLVHRPPHVGQTVTELYGRIVNDDPVPPSRISSQVPRDLETIVLKALEKAPERRYPAAQEFADDLARFLAHEPIHARPAGALDRLVRWGRRRRALVTGIAVAAVAVLAGGALALRQGRAERERGAWLGELDQVRADIDRLERLQDRGAIDDEVVLGRLRSAEERVLALLGRMDLAAGRALLGRIHELGGRDDAAREDWRRALAIDPDHAAARYQLGHSLMVRVVLDLLSRTTTQRRKFRPEAERMALDASALIEAAVSPGSTLESDLQRDLARAILLYAKGDVEGVRKIAGPAVERFPADRGAEEMHLFLGLVSTNAGDKIAAFTAALALRPRYAAARFARGLTLIGTSEIARAIEDFDAAIRFDPRLAAAYANRAGVRGDQGDIAAVIRDCDRAIEIDPRCGAAYCYRATALHRVGRLAEALEDCRRALTLDPEDPMAVCARAAVLAEQGDFDGAMADCTLAIRLAPEYPNSYGIRSGLYNSKSRFAEGEADASRGIELQPMSTSCLVNRGFARLMLGRPAEALADYDEAVRSDGRMAVAFLGRARVKQVLKDLDGAVQDAARALEVAPPEWPTREKVRQYLEDLKRR